MPLKWDQIQVPILPDASRSIGDVGRNISSGLDGLRKSLQRFRDEQKSVAESELLGRLQQYENEVDARNALAQGIITDGITPQHISPEARFNLNKMIEEMTGLTGSNIDNHSKEILNVGRQLGNQNTALANISSALGNAQSALNLDKQHYDFGKDLERDEALNRLVQRDGFNNYAEFKAFSDNDPQLEVARYLGTQRGLNAGMTSGQKLAFDENKARNMRNQLNRAPTKEEMGRILMASEATPEQVIELYNSGYIPGDLAQDFLQVFSTGEAVDTNSVRDQGMPYDLFGGDEVVDLARQNRFSIPAAGDILGLGYGGRGGGVGTSHFGNTIPAEGLTDEESYDLNVRQYSNADPTRFFGDGSKNVSLGDFTDDISRKIIKHNKENHGVNSSATGAYQLTSVFVKDFAPKVFGKDWKDVPFNFENQTRLVAHAIDEIKNSNSRKLTNYWVGLRSDIDRDSSLTPQQKQEAIRAREQELRALDTPSLVQWIVDTEISATPSQKQHINRVFNEVINSIPQEEAEKTYQALYDESRNEQPQARTASLLEDNTIFDPSNPDIVRNAALEAKGSNNDIIKGMLNTPEQVDNVVGIIQEEFDPFMISREFETVKSGIDGGVGHIRSIYESQFYQDPNLAKPNVAINTLYESLKDHTNISKKEINKAYKWARNNTNLSNPDIAAAIENAYGEGKSFLESVKQNATLLEGGTRDSMQAQIQSFQGMENMVENYQNQYLSAMQEIEAYKNNYRLTNEQKSELIYKKILELASSYKSLRETIDSAKTTGGLFKTPSLQDIY